MKRLVLVVLFACAASAAIAQPPAPALHITPTGDGFENDLAAAMTKKHVPARIVERAERATLTLKATPIDVRKDATSTKVMKCVFSSCAGIDERARTSVRLVDREGTVLWSYSVSGDRDDRGRMAEAIAKHLKNEYFGQSTAAPLRDESRR